MDRLRGHLFGNNGGSRLGQGQQASRILFSYGYYQMPVRHPRGNIQ